MTTPSKRQKTATRTGQVQWTGNRYSVRIRFADGVRRRVPLPLGLSEEEAKEHGRRLAQKAFEEGWTSRKQTGPVHIARDLTAVPAWFEAYLDHKLSRGQAVEAPTSHARTWILPHLGSKRMDEVTPDDLRRLVAKLDRAIEEEEIRWKSATNIWGTVTKAFKDATNSKDDRFRILQTNPALGLPPPDKGRETKKVHLFPSEFLALVSCDVVPVARRRAYAIATYIYLRPGELEALDWKDFDLAHEQVTIQRSVDRERGGFKAPKNGMARMPMSIEPELLPLLVAMYRESGGSGLLVGSNAGLSAETLRADLLLAGVDRHELHHGSNDPPREWMTLHDLRTTGITWMAVRGDGLLLVKARAGHADSKMTEHYISLAAVLRKQHYGEPFPALPDAIVDPEGGTQDADDEPTERPSVLH